MDVTQPKFRVIRLVDIPRDHGSSSVRASPADRRKELEHVPAVVLVGCSVKGASSITLRHLCCARNKSGLRFCSGIDYFRCAFKSSPRCS